MKTLPILLALAATTVACAPPAPPPPHRTTTTATTATTTATATLPAVVTLGGEPGRWRVDVVVHDDARRTRLLTLGPALGAIVAEVERQHDLDRSDGELRRFNRTPTRQPLPVARATLDVVAECLHLGRLSDGSFDVTAGPVVALWSADGAVATTTMTTMTTPPPDRLAQARARSGLNRLRPVGGMLKKDIVDLVVDTRPVVDAVSARGIVAALAEREVGGDFRVAVGDVVIADGAGLDGPWRDLDGAALSSTTGRVVQSRSRAPAGLRTIDPRTARPVTHDVVGCDVVGRGVDPVAARGLAEACLVLGEEGTNRVRARFGDVEVRALRSGG